LVWTPAEYGSLPCPRQRTYRPGLPATRATGRYGRGVMSSVGGGSRVNPNSDGRRWMRRADGRRSGIRSGPPDGIPAFAVLHAAAAATSVALTFALLSLRGGV
jgi:hypothetical protein